MMINKVDDTIILSSNEIQAGRQNFLTPFHNKNNKFCWGKKIPFWCQTWKNILSCKQKSISIDESASPLLPLLLYFTYTPPLLPLPTAFPSLSTFQPLISFDCDKILFRYLIPRRFRWPLTPPSPSPLLLLPLFIPPALPLSCYPCIPFEVHTLFCCFNCSFIEVSTNFSSTIIILMFYFVCACVAQWANVNYRWITITSTIVNAVTPEVTSVHIERCNSHQIYSNQCNRHINIDYLQNKL